MSIRHGSAQQNICYIDEGAQYLEPESNPFALAGFYHYKPDGSKHLYKERKP